MRECAGSRQRVRFCLGTLLRIEVPHGFPKLYGRGYAH
jgi:hypothetical protein